MSPNRTLDLATAVHQLHTAALHVQPLTTDPNIEALATQQLAELDPLLDLVADIAIKAASWMAVEAKERHALATRGGGKA